MAEKVNQNQVNFQEKEKRKEFNRIEQLTKTARYQLAGR